MPSANYGSTFGACCGCRDGGRTQSTIGKPISTTTSPGILSYIAATLIKVSINCYSGRSNSTQTLPITFLHPPKVGNLYDEWCVLSPTRARKQPNSPCLLEHRFLLIIPPSIAFYSTTLMRSFFHLFLSCILRMHHLLHMGINIHHSLPQLRMHPHQHLWIKRHSHKKRARP